MGGRAKAFHTPGMTDHYEYNVHLIPTQYTDWGGWQVDTFQYSGTELYKSFEAGTSKSTPGIYLIYDLTPFIAVITETRKSCFDFATEACALIGGIFAFSRLVDTLGYQVARSVARLVMQKDKSRVFDDS